jgi:hypothetical protein
MKRSLFATLFSASILLGLTGAPAFAQSAHFVGKVTASLTDTGVQVCFKEAGLGSTPVEVGATADVTAIIVCVNKGGECPNAANKRTISGPLENTVTVTPRNGQITVCVPLETPEAPDFCPGGQTETLSTVTFANLAAEDLTNDVTESASPSSLSQTLFTCP